MGVSKNNGTPKSSILIGFSIINHPFWGTPIFGNTYMFSHNSFGSLAFSGLLGDPFLLSPFATFFSSRKPSPSRGNRNK